MLVSFDSSDGPNPTWADTLRRLNQARRSIDSRWFEWRDFKIPVLVNGHRIWGPFDSGSDVTMLNWAAARLIGLMPPAAGVEGDTSGLACYRATDFASCYDAKWGTYSATPGAVWSEDAGLQLGSQRLSHVAISVFENWPFPTDMYGSHSAPHFALGVDAFRDRVLLLSYSTGMVCVSGPRAGTGSGRQ